MSRAHLNAGEQQRERESERDEVLDRARMMAQRPDLYATCLGYAQFVLRIKDP